ncbi:MAG: HK97 gp10 family phage protein [bacterium]|nr:HK97 gp10 family phage protein [bacterium]
MGTIAKIEGLDNLLNKLNSIADPETYKEAIDKACRSVEYAAKKNCTGLFEHPTGALKASITHEVVQEGEQIVGYVGTKVEYAPYQEFGTGKFAENGDGRKTPWAYTDERTGETIWTAGNKPKPFLRPALQDRTERVRQILVAAVNQAQGQRRNNGGVERG